MLASQRRERTARASYHDAAVAFDVCERAKMLVHQLTRRDRASFHTSRQAFSCGQFERQLPPRAAKQRLQLMTLQRLREHIDKMVDVSLRLSLSEPLIFSSSVPGRRASDARLTSLRGFSASGRQPAVRVEYQATQGQSTADGWFAAATLPLTGELTIPFTDAASFEFEGRPKGVFLEAYRRTGLTSVGGHAFIGDERRRVITAVATHDVGGRLALLAGVGAFHSVGVTDTRFSFGGEVTLSSRLVGGIRVDHRTGQGRDPAVLLYGNGHLPFGPAAFRQAFRLQIEHRIQPANHVTGFALSHIF